MLCVCWVAAVVILQDGWSKASKSFKAGITSDLGCPTAGQIDDMVNKTGSGIVVILPKKLIFHATRRNEGAQMTAFYPVVVTKTHNKLKFDRYDTVETQMRNFLVQVVLDDMMRHDMILYRAVPL